MAVDVAPNAIAGEQDRAAKQGVARAFEEDAIRKLDNRKTVSGKPGFEVRRLPRPYFMPETRAVKLIAENQSRVGGEHEIGQTLLRLQQFDANTQPLQRF